MELQFSYFLYCLYSVCLGRCNYSRHVIIGVFMDVAKKNNFCFYWLWILFTTFLTFYYLCPFYSLTALTDYTQFWYFSGFSTPLPIYVFRGPYFGLDIQIVVSP